METKSYVNQIIEDLRHKVTAIAVSITENTDVIINNDDFIQEAIYILTKVANQYNDNEIEYKDEELKRYIINTVRYDLFNLIEYYRVREKLYKTQSFTYAIEHKHRDILGELLESCHDEVERDLIHLRADGYTLKQISEKLDLSIAGLSRMLDKIHIRFVGVFE